MNYTELNWNSGLYCTPLTKGNEQPYMARWRFAESLSGLLPTVGANPTASARTPRFKRISSASLTRAMFLTPYTASSLVTGPT